ncbi:type I polyketide synthase [Actinokineospora inagensis]|uniref:type I polyketide synthase n=1 Tax=Actinokineospora inagensis TaxID=103730 RepID=UPI000556A9AE|nr:type I polyketide synthase [Actinokineospora inagensis]
MTDRGYDPDLDIAVVGMAGRFPGASDVTGFWRACVAGTSKVSTWDGPRRGAGQVLAGGLLSDPDLFDANAFGVTPAEAELLDPQHRVFLEVCWLALDDAAIRDDLVSVYAAAAPSRYAPVPGARDDLNARYQQMIANAPDYLATRVSYLLDLRGEAVNVQTACSSSLVAVHLAVQSLRAGTSDAALAGGVSIDPDQHLGYVHQEGMISSPDGVLLPFDAAARGAVPGNGAAVVVLQRLGDALAGGRRVHGVIRGTAVNNDGRDKSSFMAPAPRGQTEAIASALADAGVDAGTIGYLEAHGTGTRLGDPIEFAAASRAFRAFTDREAFCALGSLKANFGHLDRAAGIAALVKAVHVVRDGVVPPLLGFRTPNPQVALAGSPFRIPGVADTAWPSDGPRRAGVSAFGVGGTNAHVVVEEYRETRTRVNAVGPFALPLSAHDATAVAELATGLADRVQAAFAGVARTLGAGRRDLGTRAVVVARDGEEAARQLREPLLTQSPGSGSLAFLFAGQGVAVRYDPRELLDRYAVFRREIEAFADAHRMSVDDLLDGVSGGPEKYRGLAYQPSLVAVQVALARLAEHLGATPSAYCGSSIGEYAAAYLTGVFGRAELMSVLGARDRLMRATPEGRMMAVYCGAEQITGLLAPGIELAGDNAIDRVLVSGTPDAIERQVEVLAARGVETRVLPGRIAPHGSMMSSAADGLREVLASTSLNRSTGLPIVSSLTGDWVTPDQLAGSEHWVRHLCRPFLMRQAFEALARSGYHRMVEASPGAALTKLAARAVAATGQAVTLGGLPGDEALVAFLGGLGALWSQGTPVRWDEANGTAGVEFASLAPYPFRRRRFWNHALPTVPSLEGLPAGRTLARPSWRPAQPTAGGLPRHVVLRGGDGGLAPALEAELIRHDVRVDRLRPDAPTPEAGAVLMDLTLVDGGPDEPTSWLDAGLFGPLDAVRLLAPSRFIAVTRGLFPVLPGEQADPRLAAVVGLVRCAPHEWPRLTTALVDLQTDDVSALVTELGADEDRDVAYRDGVRYRRYHEPIHSTAPTRLRDGGVYLVLGGTGRLGPVVAAAIAAEVRAEVVLTGRSPDRPRPEAERALLDQARGRGLAVVERRLDSSDPAALTALLDELTHRHGRVDGVFHLAAHTAVDQFPLLADVDPPGASVVVDAKVRTAANLATALRDRDHDFVVLFSSISTLIGALRFGPYVSANAYLDALASRMSTGIRPWLSVVWDSWTASGATTEDALGSSDGAGLLRQVLRCDEPVVFAVAGDVERRRAAVLADLAAVADAARTAVAPDGASPTRNAVLDTIERVTGHRITDSTRRLAGLGIDSLQMMQIAARLRPVLGPEVSLGAILAARSLSDIIGLADRDRADDAVRGGPDVPAVEPGELSSVQQRLWYLAQLEPDLPTYNVPFGWRLPGTVDDAERAVRAVLAKHELLRSTYRSTADGTPRRIVLNADEVEVDRVELTGAPDEAFQTAARACVDRVFDLERAAGRVLLGHVGGGGVRVLFVFHHISMDAWSARIIRDDLRRALAGALEPPSGGYHEFVRWEHEVRSAADYPRHLEFWRTGLAGARPTEPPADEGVTAAPGTVGLLHRLVPGDVTDRLREVLRAEGVTLYTAGLTGLALALARWSGERDVVVGTNLANRARVEFEDVVGMFVDPVVLRLRPTERPDGTAATTLGDALAGVRARFAEALGHAEVPHLDVARAAGRGALFSVIATMFATEDADGLPAIDVPLPTTSKFPFAIELLPRADGLLLHVLYAADRYRKSTVERWVAYVEDFLRTLAKVGVEAALDAPDAPAAAERFARRWNRAGAAEDTPWAP